MLTVTKGTLQITETTLRDCLKIIDKVKENIKITDKPMPDCDLSVKDRIKLQKERGKIEIFYIYIYAPYSNNQESLGYQLQE